MTIDIDGGFEMFVFGLMIAKRNGGQRERNVSSRPLFSV